MTGEFKHVRGGEVWHSDVYEGSEQQREAARVASWHAHQPLYRPPRPAFDLVALATEYRAAKASCAPEPYDYYIRLAHARDALMHAVDADALAALILEV